jgi:hypothetical protein
MKKFLFVLMAVCLTFAMIGCDKDSPDPGTPQVNISYNNGSADANAPTAPVTVTIDKGGSLSTDELTALAGFTSTAGLTYAWKGWYDTPSGGTAITTTTPFEADATIYAQWTVTVPAGKVLIKFDRNYGTGYTVDEVVINAGAAGTAWPTDPTRTGRLFKGWWDEAFDDGMGEDTGTAIKYESTTVLTGGETYTLFAYWEFNRIKITFDWNYGTEVDTEVDIQQDFPIGNYLPVKVRADYELAGWTTTKDTLPLVNWDVGGDNEVVATATITYHAIWWSTVLTVGDAEEKLALENGAYALYKFTIDDDWANYDKVSVTYKVSEAQLNKGVNGYRLMGAYYADYEYGTNNLSDVGGVDGGKSFKLVTKDRNGVTTIKLIASSYFNGGYIMDNKTGGSVYTGATADTWFTIDYNIKGSGTDGNPHSQFSSVNMPKKDTTFYLGIGITPGGGESKSVAGKVDFSDKAIIQLVKDVVLVKGATEVKGVKPTGNEPSFVGYVSSPNMESVQQSWRGLPTATPSVDVVASIPGKLRITNPSFTGWGDQGGKTGNVFDFERTTNGSRVTLDLTATDTNDEPLYDYSDATTVTLFYTLQKVAADDFPIKLTISNRDKDDWSGTPEVNEYKDYVADTFLNTAISGGAANENYRRYLTIPIASFATNDYITFEHNDGGQTTATKFKITINEIVFE